jgi:hypothetical protein
MLQQVLRDAQQLEQEPPQQQPLRDQQQQQQQSWSPSSSNQQGQGHDAKGAVQTVLHIAAKQVSLYQYLNSIWPASSSSRSSLSSSSSELTLPAVHLSMLVLQVCEGRSPYVNIALAATMQLSEGLQEELQAKQLTQLRCAAAHTAGVTGTGSSNSAGSLNPVVQQLLQSEQLLLLLVAAQALLAKMLQDSRGISHQGSSRTSSVAMAPIAAAAAAARGPAAAEALLHAVGIHWTRSAASLFYGWDQATITKCITDSLSDTVCVLTHMLHISEEQPLLPLTRLLLQLPVTFLQPWALLQLQCLQLLNSCQSKHHCLRILMALVTAARGLNAAEHAALKSSLLQPVLLLWPYIPQMPASGSRAASTSSSSSSSGSAAAPDHAAVAGLELLQVASAGVLLKMLFDGEHRCKQSCQQLNGSSTVTAPLAWHSRARAAMTPSRCAWVVHSAYDLKLSAAWLNHICSCES